ncbi:amidohydrolase family protein [Sphingomonas sp.]|uniref:N-acyl-D-amino-acid deacylase family protein n=1 Tax=Sphingomonas sp. TaxID=28214 RepID=UPI001B1A7355|nr:amidohydrolase family protein [Sphingomonas sp.]MBO9713321.1 amidohydrolase family protein [Sphingomonas sp.]
MLFALAAAPAPEAPAHYDVLIRGGTVFDGTGSPGRKADVAIDGDRIVKVGDVPKGATAGTVIDATGKIVSPGFIDVHSHASPGIETPELAAALPILYQGIATVVINPDGKGPADLAPQFERIRALTPGVNLVPMIGHNAVREAVMGLANRDPSPEELARMEGLVARAMDLGAFGLSSGPFYVPGKYSKTPELVALARVAARYPGAVHSSHIRDEASYDVGVLAAIAELIQVSRETGIRGVVTHMKMLGPSVWGKSGEAIRMIEAARAEGLSIWADQYPYTASGSNLAAALTPDWAQEGGPAALAERLRDPAQRARIRDAMAASLVLRGGAATIQIRDYPTDRSLEGKRLDAIAAAQGLDPRDMAIEMLIKGGAKTVSFNMSDDDVDAIMRQPWTMTSTDGALVRFGEGSEHPRAYGAFPRKIRAYVLDRPVLPMAQAIHSMTGLPAQVFGIVDRGVLKPGAFADVLVFDPRTIRDTATYEQPHAYAQGVVAFFINGRAAVLAGKATPGRFGRLLLRPR